MTSLKIKTVADHGYSNASANPSKFPAGLFSICTGSYDLKHAFCEVTRPIPTSRRGALRTAAPSASPKPCTRFERATDALAQKLNMDPAELRMKNFIKPEQFPYNRCSAGEYDSGQLTARPQESDGHHRLRCTAPRADGEGARRAETHGHRHLELHRRSSAPARRGTSTILG